MKKLLVSLFLLLAVQAQAGLREDPIASLPTDPPDGTTRIVVDGLDEADCTEGGGGKVVLCTFRGGIWVAGGGGALPGPEGLQANFLVIPYINTATSAAPITLGNGSQDTEGFGDPTKGFRWRPKPLGDVKWPIWPNFTGCFYDEEAELDILCFNPDASTMAEKFLFQPGYYPLKSFYVSVGSMDGDGTNCPATATTVTHNSGPKLLAIICGSGGNGDLDFHVVMPTDWVDNSTLQFLLEFSQTAADTAAMHSDIKAQCRGAGETPSSTWGTAIPMDVANVTGSSAINHVTSAAVTPAGTCAAGDSLFVRWTLDVTGTTTPEATLRIFGIKPIYSTKSLSH